MSDVSLRGSDLVRNITVKVHIKGMGIVRVRLALAVLLIRLAVRVGGFGGLKVDTGVDDAAR